MYYVYADGASIYNPLDESLGIIAPKVSLELGKAGSFQFDIPPTNAYYDKLQQLKTIITVNLDDTEIFRGRVFSIERKFNNIKTVQCEGVLAYLVDSVQKAVSFNGKANKLLKKIISNHNSMMGSTQKQKQFTLVSDIDNDAVYDTIVVIPGKKDEDDKYYGTKKYEQAIIESIVDEWMTSFDYINDVIIDYLGGYLVARRKNDKNYLDLVSAEKLDSSMIWCEENGVGFKTIEFGTNLIDFTEEVNAEELFTVLIPLGDDNLTVKDVSHSWSPKGSNEITNPNKDKNGLTAVDKYGRIVRTHVFDNVNDANTLMEDGVKYLKANKNLPVTFTVKAIDMHFIDESNKVIEIGEVVRLRSNPHKVTKMLICTKIEYDLQNPGNTSYTFGNPKQTMTERYKKNKDKEKKSTKSHSAKGGGGGAAAAAADAQDMADEAEQAAVDRVYDAWIKVDPDSGHITLGTLYQKTKDALTSAGIDLDSGPEGSKVNINVLNQRVDEQGRLIGENSAAITAAATDLESKIEAQALWTEDNFATLTLLSQEEESRIDAIAQLKSDTSTALSGLELKANNHEAVLKTFTNFDKYLDKDGKVINSNTVIEQLSNSMFSRISQTAQYKSDVTDSMASIRQLSTNNRSVLEFMASYKTNADGSVNKASIQIEANAAKSVITLAATEVRSEAAAYFKTIESNYVKTSELTASKINSLIGNITGKLTVNGNMEMNANLTMNGAHSASIPTLTVGTSASIKTLYVSDGNGYISLKSYIEKIVKDTIDGTYVNNLVTKKTVRAKLIEGSTATNVTNYIKNIIDSDYIHSKVDRSYIRNTLKGDASSFQTYICNQITTARVQALIDGQEIKPATVTASSVTTKSSGKSYNVVNTKKFNAHTHKIDLGNHIHTYYQDINGTKKQFNTGSKSLSGTTGNP